MKSETPISALAQSLVSTTTSTPHHLITGLTSNRISIPANRPTPKVAPVTRRPQTLPANFKPVTTKFIQLNSDEAKAELLNLYNKLGGITT